MGAPPPSFGRNAPRRRETPPFSQMPAARSRISIRALAVLLLCFQPLVGAAGTCDFYILHRNIRYNYSLASPTLKHPHGLMSEDGFYKVAVNKTSLWFQLCDQMIFNHDPPRCYACEGCGGPLHCGMKCSALVANDLGVSKWDYYAETGKRLIEANYWAPWDEIQLRYYVCRTVGQPLTSSFALMDKNKPQKGVIIEMSAPDHQNNCSLSVSVYCDPNVAQEPDSLSKLGTCNYATVLRHPSGCAKVVSSNGSGLGWFGTLLIVIICLFGGYIMIGAVYQFFFLGIRSAEAIPNLEFWLSLPQRARVMFSSLVRRFRGQSQSQRASYDPANY